MDYTPPDNFTTSSGAYIAISPYINSGVITYLVLPSESEAKTIAVTAGSAAMIMARGMLQMQATAQAGAFATIQVQQGASMMRGFL